MPLGGVINNTQRNPKWSFWYFERDCGCFNNEKVMIIKFVMSNGWSKEHQGRIRYHNEHYESLTRKVLTNILKKN